MKSHAFHEACDDGVRRSVMREFGRIVGVEVFYDILGEDFAELNAPLVEGEDIPDNTLDENLLFVEGHEDAEHAGGQFVGDQRIGRSVALEDHVRLEGRILGCAFFEDAAEREGFRLGDEIREQFLMMVSRRRLRLAEADEIGGNQLRALMKELIETVLSVRSGLAPDDRAGLPFDFVVVLRDVFAVAFHIDLLQMRGEAVHGLVIREDGVGLGAEEVVVPDAEESHDDRHVLVERRLAEMFVHGVEAFEHLREVFGADLDHDGQTDGGVEGVAAADPVPETEHVVRVDTEIRDFLGSRGHGDEMLRDGGGVIVESSENPLFGGVGVRHGLHRRERLGGDDEKRLFRIEFVDGVDHVETVDIGDEINMQTFLGERLESFAGHLGAEIGAADTDVDDVLDGLTCITFPFA